METQLLLSLELLVMMKEGEVAELDPEPGFMSQDCFQNKDLQLAEKAARHMADNPRTQSQNSQSVSNKHGPTSSLSCRLLADGQGRRYVELLGSVPNTKSSKLLF